MKKFFVVIICLGFLLSPSPIKAISGADGTLIKATDSSTVYLVKNNVRYAFPDQKTYQSWHGNDFSLVQTAASEQLSSYRLGGVVTYKPGSLIKIQSDPKVYEVLDDAGLISWVSSEQEAIGKFGSNWAGLVRDIPASFFTNYSVRELANEIVSEVVSEETYNIPAIIEDISGEVQGSSKIFKTISIDPVSGLLIMVIFSDNNLSVKLTNPSGQIVVPDGSVAGSVFFSYEKDQLVGYYGDWGLELDNQSAQTISYRLSAIGESNIFINHNDVTRLDKDEPLRFSVSLGEDIGTNFQPLKGSSVVAKIFSLENMSTAIRSIVLSDTGQADGFNLQIYRSDYVSSLNSGEYYVKYFINGNKLSGAPFKRIGTTNNESLVVSSDNVRPLSIMSEKGQDTDGDGLVDLIYVQFLVDVVGLRQFDITGVLVDSQGNENTASIMAGGSDGQYGINLIFDLRGGNFANGIFTLKDVRFFETVDDQVRWVADWREEYRTESYIVTQ